MNTTLATHAPIDTPSYVGNSLRRVIVANSQGYQFGVTECYAYSLAAGIRHLIPDMPEAFVTEACRALRGPNDFGEAIYDGWQGYRVCQTWAWATLDEYPPQALMRAALAAGRGMFSGGYWARMGREGA
jgi:hypothetical protein